MNHPVAFVLRSSSSKIQIGNFFVVFGFFFCFRLPRSPTCRRMWTSWLLSDKQHVHLLCIAVRWFLVYMYCDGTQIRFVSLVHNYLPKTWKICILIYMNCKRLFKSHCELAPNNYTRRAMPIKAQHRSAFFFLSRECVRVLLLCIIFRADVHPFDSWRICAVNSNNNDEKAKKSNSTIEIDYNNKWQWCVQRHDEKNAGPQKQNWIFPLCILLFLSVGCFIFLDDRVSDTMPDIVDGHVMT